MSNKNKFFSKKTIDPKDVTITGITAVNILDQHLITGDEKGNIATYEFSKNDTLFEVKKANLSSKAKIEKIEIQNSKKYAFVLVGGEVFYVNIPTLTKTASLFKSKDTINIFVNNEDDRYKNMILVLNKKKKLKMYEFSITQDKPSVNEKKMIKDFTLDDVPNCGIWTDKNYFIYSFKEEKDGKLKGTDNWLNLETGNVKFDDFPGIVEIKNLGEKIAVSDRNYTLFMKDGASYAFT